MPVDCKDILEVHKVTDEEVWEIFSKYADDPEARTAEIGKWMKRQDMKIRQAQIQVGFQRQLLQKVEKTPQNFLDVVERTGGAKRGIEPTVQEYIWEVVGDFQTQLAEFMEAYKPKMFGLAKSNRAMRNMVTEVFSENANTGDGDAKKYAGMIRQLFKNARDRWKVASVQDVSYLQNYGIPMFHDAAKIGGVDKAEWIADTKRVINESRLGGDIDEVLGEIYETLSTDKTRDIDPTKFSKSARSLLGNRHQEHRALHFMNGKAYLQYFDKYGSGRLYDSLTSHIEMLGREIGAMEKLGPDPDQTIDMLHRATRSKGKFKSDWAKNTYDTMMGKNLGNRGGLREYSQMLRNLETGFRLPFAALTAIGDLAPSTITALYRGLPVMKTYGRMIKNLMTGSSADRKLLAELGLGADWGSSSAIRAHRYADVVGYGKSAQFADSTIKLSGLEHWTYALKATSDMSHMARLGDLAARKVPFNDLPTKTRRMFDEYGIDEVDWKNMHGRIFNKDGVDLLDLTKIRSLQARRKVVGAIKTETRFAVPENTSASRALLLQGTEAGTPVGEIGRSAAQFQGYGTYMLISHLMRATNQHGGGAGYLKYFGSLIAGSTALGMVALWAKAAARGEEPEDVTWEFIARGMVQGGSLTPIMDYMATNPDYYGGGAQRALGPVLSDSVNVFKFMWGSAKDVYEMEKEFDQILVDAGVKAKRSIRAFPGQLWWSSLLLRNAIIEPLQRVGDPQWLNRQNQLQNKLREKGSGQWSRPSGRFMDVAGEISPISPPEVKLRGISEGVDF